MPHNTDGKLGVKLTETISVTADSRFDIGMQVPASDGADYVYTRAGGAVAAGDVVSILVDGTVAAITTTTASVGSAVGFAQTAIAAGSFGWVALRGPNLQVNVLAACAPEVMLFTTSTAGHLDDAYFKAFDGVVLNLKQGDYNIVTNRICAICNFPFSLSSFSLSRRIHE